MANFSEMGIQVVESEESEEGELPIAKAEKAGLQTWGETLATAPRGYAKDHERIGLLRRKSLSLGASLSFGRGIGPSDALQFVANTWRAAAPVARWLDERVGASALPAARPARRR